MAAHWWTIGLVLQPPNSLNTNTKDLVLFCVMQLLQITTTQKNIGKLIVSARKMFSDYPMDLYKKIWTMAQMVINKIPRCDGVSTYTFLTETNMSSPFHNTQYPTVSSMPRNTHYWGNWRGGCQDEPGRWVCRVKSSCACTASCGIGLDLDRIGCAPIQTIS